ncbi:MAG: hypothetical protein K0S27_1030 [Gammaproteobacteria bacterium]|jgi:hypothetical protein|nr:hypothetical protein [Gammaproteobacteria bacterium]
MPDFSTLLLKYYSSVAKKLFYRISMIKKNIKIIAWSISFLIILLFFTWPILMYIFYLSLMHWKLSSIDALFIIFIWHLICIGFCYFKIKRSHQKIMNICANFFYGLLL